MDRNRIFWNRKTRTKCKIDSFIQLFYYYFLASAAVILSRIRCIHLKWMSTRTSEWRIPKKRKMFSILLHIKKIEFFFVWEFCMRWRVRMKINIFFMPWHIISLWLCLKSREPRIFFLLFIIFFVSSHSLAFCICICFINITHTHTSYIPFHHHYPTIRPLSN